MLKYFDFLDILKLLGVVIASQAAGSLLFATILGMDAFFSGLLSFFGTIVASILLKSKLGIRLELQKRKLPF